MSSTRIDCPAGEWTAVTTLGNAAGSLNLIKGHVILVESAGAPADYDQATTATAGELDVDNRKEYYTGIAAADQVWAWPFVASSITDSPAG